MTVIRRAPLLAGAATATGPTVVIDAFRAFATAAYALAGGAERVVLADTVEEALALGPRLTAVIVGEEGGRRPAGFHLGNSPAEVLRAGVGGVTMVLRSSAGTRAVRASLEAGAGPVWAAALPVLSATARSVGGRDEVVLVPAGHRGEGLAEEDEACADFLEQALVGEPPDRAALLARAAGGDGARRLAEADWADPADLGLCLALDLFGFALPVETDGDLVVIQRDGQGTA